MSGDPNSLRFLTIPERIRRRQVRWVLGALISVGLAVGVAFLLPT